MNQTVMVEVRSLNFFLLKKEYTCKDFAKVNK